MLSKNIQKISKSLTSTFSKPITTQQQLFQSLEAKDAVLYNIIEQEKVRQVQGVNLIASENHCSKAVLEALGTHMNIKYSDGHIGQRGQPGCRYVDQVELLCQQRALEAFNLNPEEWGVDVQSYSGCHANFAVFSGLLKPHDRIMGLDLPHGGHLSHGFQTRTKKISMVSQYFESLPYRLSSETEQIDYNQMQELASLYNPKILIAGASAYSRLIDYKKFKEVSDSIGAYLLSDMAHISGLVAAGVVPSPFDYSDIVTTTTHKSLRGPRGSMIFYRKGVRSVNKKGKQIMYDLESNIKFAVSPLLQSSPHNNQTAAIAVALKQAKSPEYVQYQKQVLSNAQVFANQFEKLGYSLVSGGTDNHLLLLNLKKSKLDGSRTEKLLDQLLISSNKNTVPGDSSALNPGGLRVGAPAMTTRGCEEQDFIQIANIMDQAFKLIPKLKKECGGKKIVDFNKYIAENEIPEIQKLKSEVIGFASQFPVPGI